MIRISKKGVLIICCWKAVHPPLSLDVIRHKEGRLFLKKNYCIKFVFLYPSRKCILCRRIWCPFKVTYWYHFFSLICRYEEDEIHKLPENAVRPIARTALTWDQVSISFNSLSIHEDKFGNWWPENRGGGFGYRLSRLITMATCKQEPSPSPPPPPPPWKWPYQSFITLARQWKYYTLPTYTYTNFLLNVQKIKIHGGWEDSF